MTQTWLIPIDESETAMKPIEWLLANRALWREMPQIHLLNVQASLPRDIGRFINAETIREFHNDTGTTELLPATKKLIAAGITPKTHILVGDPAATIAKFADENLCAQILIGSRGHSGIAGTLLGSVASRLVNLSTVPLLIVR
ncbi:MAG: universal stress protein [Rhodocyclaceae bacterium]|nr:universal stress protein [Rhodocyclaceae bacterium]MBP6110319.1 universal stress protein [Rhodocyclaceae bacterium]MBP6279514.1 universal stress protein [Rhodocyclaceae bacterium]